MEERCPVTLPVHQVRSRHTTIGTVMGHDSGGGGTVTTVAGYFVINLNRGILPFSFSLVTICSLSSSASVARPLTLIKYLFNFLFLKFNFCKLNLFLAHAFFELTRPTGVVAFSAAKSFVLNAIFLNVYKFGWFFQTFLPVYVFYFFWFISFLLHLAPRFW